MLGFKTKRIGLTVLALTVAFLALANPVLAAADDDDDDDDEPLVDEAEAERARAQAEEEEMMMQPGKVSTLGL